MQVPLTDAVLTVPVPTGGGIIARVVAGNLTAVPIGALLQATVTSVKPREVTLTVNGQALTVQAPPGLRPGSVLLVRVPPGAQNAINPTIELSVPPNAAPSQQGAEVAPALPEVAGRAARSPAAPAVPTAPATPPTADRAKPTAPSVLPAQTAAVEVLESLPDGRFRVAVEGDERLATSAKPLVVGERYVLQVERTPSGVALKPPPETPALPTEVARAILRAPAPALGDTIQPLQKELATLAEQPRPGEPSLPPAARDAATTVRETLRALVPNDPRPLKPAELRQLVENGGVLYETKLARLVAPIDADAETPAPTPATQAETKPGAKPAIETREAATPEAKPTTTEAKLATPSASRSPAELAPDLKGDLLRLLQTVQDLGGADRAPAAHAALHGIEAQQAGNALANGTAYFLQVPFPDGGEWRTLHLSLEPRNLPDQPDAERAGRFRMFMHVPLSELGETWIEAGLAGNRFRATIYLDAAAVRDRVRTALPELRAELEADGFTEVLLDVRASTELPDRQRRETGAVQAGRPEGVSVLDVRV